MSDKLAGLRVLITRPQAQLKAWRQLLQSEGAEVDSVSVLTIEAVSDAREREAVKARILAFDEYQHIIFVSQNAVRYGLEWLDRYWPQLPVGINYYAIGSSTAEMLSAEGLEVNAGHEAMDSEELVELMQSQLKAQDKVLIFRGIGGRPRLAEALAERDCSVDYCQLYHRLMPEQAASQLLELESEPDVIAVHSGESLFNLDSLLDECQRPHWRQKTLLVASERLAELARARGFERVVCARNATNSAMLKALTSWNKRRLLNEVTPD